MERQLAGLSEGELDKVTWAKNCSQLSVYYLNGGAYQAAERCLQAALKVLPEGAEADDRAALAIGFGRYYLRLLNRGYNAALEKEPDPQIRAREADKISFKTLVDGEEVKEEQIGMPEVKFSSLELTEYTADGAQIVDYESCLEMWKKCSHWFGVAKDHFVMDGYVTDHIDIAQDMSRSYKILAYFEKDNSRKCKMHKRRVDLLTPIEEVISASTYNMQSKQLAWELSEIHDLMFDIKASEDLAPDAKGTQRHIEPD